MFDDLTCFHSLLQLDVVYTSWLSRAIETAWLVMNEIDSLCLPVVKTWRLNERMCKNESGDVVHYISVESAFVHLVVVWCADGALTGLSKKMVKQRHGSQQVWRMAYGALLIIFRTTILRKFSPNSIILLNHDMYLLHALKLVHEMAPRV
jgi:hypothetical protein